MSHRRVIPVAIAIVALGGLWIVYRRRQAQIAAQSSTGGYVPVIYGRPGDAPFPLSGGGGGGTGGVPDPSQPGQPPPPVPQPPPVGEPRFGWFGPGGGGIFFPPKGGKPGPPPPLPGPNKGPVRDKGFRVGGTIGY